MERNLKKSLAFILVLCLLLTLFPMSVFASGQETSAPTIVDYSVSSAEHDDNDEEANQIIEITIEFSKEIKLLSDDLSEDIDILIAGGNVLDTGREVTYAVDEENATNLIITLRSTDPDGFYAVYGGLLNVNEAAGGIQNIVSTDDDTVPVVWTDLETYIPIGIAVDNDTTEGTASAPATTTVTVTHKANMRGMYHYQLLSNGVPVGDVWDGSYYYAAAMTSHAHTFYTTITVEAIASAMATAINTYCDGYTAVYEEGDTFTVTADAAKEGEVLTVQMFEYDDDGRTVDPLLRQAIANGQSYLDSDIYTEESIAALEEAIDAAQALIGKDPSLQEQAEVKAAIADAIDALVEVQVLPESAHNYENNTDQTWTYTLDNAPDGVIITFDEQTATESNYDFIYIYDADDNEVGKYSGTALAGASVAIGTSTFSIRLTSDYSNTYWGFAVTDVEAIEWGNLAQTGAVTVADIPSIWLGEYDNEPIPQVTYLGEELTYGEDFTLSYANNDSAGTATVTITGIGDYSGSVSATFQIADEDHLLASASVTEGKQILLRQSGDTGTSYIAFENVTDDWVNSITSITLTPVEADGTVTDTGDAAYPYAPTEITFTQEDYGTAWYVSGNNIYFYRTAENPVVYVMEGHGDSVVVEGMRSTAVYPQSQIYQVTVTADKYEDAAGTVTYYTGTAPVFSIIVVEKDGTETVAASWTSEEIKEMAEFANGSSQCGMTGFRTFSGEGVSLRDLLDLAGVEVYEDDYYLLDTSDHYGNNFTYEQLFGTTRYFLESIYTDEELADTYHELVESDDTAGATEELRTLLAQKAIEAGSTVEPRINVNYSETLISGNEVGSTDLPTAENTEYNSLVVYENQFRFFYGIALTSDETATVTFDSNGGSEVESQIVKASPMTSTENTTVKSSYWVNSLVIYRGQGDEYTAPAADCATEPETPTRSGYTFAGWYTDPDCTDGNEFTFNSVVTGDITLYAKWVEDTEYDISFTDVPADSYYADAVAWAIEQGITVGTSETTFSPLASCTRAEIVTFLYRAANQPEVDISLATKFSDVEETGFYAKAVAWAVENNITFGTSSTTFSPLAPCTRAEIVTFLYRYADTPTVTSASSFADVSSDSWYAKAVAWAAENNITFGTSSTTFSPLATCDRSQCVAFLWRCFA